MESVDVSEDLVVNTSRFGEVKVARDKIITMVSPFLGFPDSKSFFLKPHPGDSPFMWLQSLDEPHLAFVILQPSLFLPEYTPELPAGIEKELEIESKKDQELLVILTVPSGNPEEMTANLLGPVFLNITKRLAKQVLLDPTQYDPCWKVLQNDNDEK